MSGYVLEDGYRFRGMGIVRNGYDLPQSTTMDSRYVFRALYFCSDAGYNEEPKIIGNLGGVNFSKLKNIDL